MKGELKRKGEVINIKLRIFVISISNYDDIKKTWENGRFSLPNPIYSFRKMKNISRKFLKKQVWLKMTEFFGCVRNSSLAFACSLFGSANKQVCDSFRSLKSLRASHSGDHVLVAPAEVSRREACMTAGVLV